MATLENIFGCIPQICLKDDKGVYLDGKKIALSNSENNGYIRRNGARSLTPLDGCSGVYDVELPLKFIGAAPNADSLKLEIAVLAALGDSENRIISSEIDKRAIADSEGISLPELTKFTNVAMIMIDYVEKKKMIYDPMCDYDLC